MVARIAGDILASGAKAAMPERMIELAMQDGSTRTLRMVKAAEEVKDERTGRTKHPARWRTDFGGSLYCERCGGTSDRDGQMQGSAGVLTIMRLDHKGLVYRTAAACSCVFGAWRHRERKDEWGTVPGMAFADHMADVPPGLSQADWQVLLLYHQSHTWDEVTKDEEGEKVIATHVYGDTYSETVNRLPEDVREPIATKIGPWLDQRPPIYDPYPVRRAMPEGE